MVNQESLPARPTRAPEEAETLAVVPDQRLQTGRLPTERPSGPVVPPPSAAGAVRSDRIGPLTSADFMPDAWQALQCAAQVAARWQDATICSIELFIGMLNDARGSLATALRRFTLDVPALRRALDPEGPEDGVYRTPIPLDIELSASVSDIVILARAVARASGREKVNEYDLLAGFAEQGGGKMGDWLRQRGFSADWLATTVFLDDGSLDRGRFDSVALDTIDRAVECARQTGYQKIGRRHVLYALLSRPDGLLPARLSAHGLDAVVLAADLGQQMPAKASPTDTAAQAPRMSGGLVTVLCRAEMEARIAVNGWIGEEHLVDALMRDARGEVADFFAQHGIRPADLVEE